MRTHRRTASLGIGLAAAMTVALLGSLPAVAAPAPDGDVGSATVVPIQITGDPAKRFDLVIMGDGYTAADMPKFREQVDHHLNVMWSIEPYKSYRNYINVYAIEIISQDSGIDCDPDLTSPRKDTPLDMAFWGGCKASSVQRLVTVNNSKAVSYANMIPGVTSANRQILALGNSDTYGGAGGAYATATGGNAMSALISPHEIGHSLGGLPDEYDYYNRGVTQGTYTGGEPRAVVFTLLTEQQMIDQQKKWWRWLGEPSLSGGVLGRHEGGQYYEKGIWRPSAHSIMKSLGYYYDQVGLEVMTAAISKKVGLIQTSTSTAASVSPASTVWVNVLHPNYHALTITWSVDGTVVPDTGNATALDLSALNLTAEAHTVTVTVVDPTDFVRDPAIRTASLTKTLTWTVDPAAAPPAAGSGPVSITESTPTSAPVGNTEMLYAVMGHDTVKNSIQNARWALNGADVPGAAGSETFPLAGATLTAGTNTVTVTVTNPDDPADSASRTWTVDNSGPEVTASVSKPLNVATSVNGEPHYVVNEQFSLLLTATDDQTGYVVREFQLDGDGWYNYFGWPTDPNAPFLFTPTGTNIDDLVYGNLGTGGMSVSPFINRTPGYGTHRVEYRGIDAAGNVGEVKAFTVTVLPSGDVTQGDQVITADVTPGGLTMSTSAPTVSMGQVTISGVDQVINKPLNPVTVTDARGSSVAWSLTGQVSAFTATSGTILAANLGWTPAASVVPGNTLQVPAGQQSAVDAGPALTPGSGLSVVSTLCSADAGTNRGAFSCGADLALGVPGSALAGDYSAVLTLTLI